MAAETTLFADLNQITMRVDLDALEVNTPPYWELLDQQANIDDLLREVLKVPTGNEPLWVTV